MYYSGHTGSSAPPFIFCSQFTGTRRVQNRGSLLFGPSSVGRRSHHTIGGPINLISVYSYEPFQGYIFIVLRYHLDPLQPLHVITNGSKCFGEKKKKKNERSRIQLRVFIRISSGLACRAEGKEYIYRLYIEYDPIYIF